ncbi:MAG: hypothetical protein ACRDZ3_07535 [Acidimicrobiia bacterium]
MRGSRLFVLSIVTAVLVAGTAWALASDDPHPAPPDELFRGGTATVLDMARLTAGSPVASPGIVTGTPEGAKVFVLRSLDRGENTSREPGRTQFEVPLYDVLTGEVAGTSTHDFICDGFFSCEDIDTYILPEGLIRQQARVSFNQDGERPGWVLVGAAPAVGPLDGTGAFAGKQGSVQVAGWADVSEMPSAVRLNETYIITILP